MSPLLIFGSSRGTGRHVLEYALAQHIPCTVLVRTHAIADELTALGANAVVGDACQSSDVAKVIELAGVDASVVCTLGGAKANYEAQRVIIDQAQSQGLKQMVLITSIGCGNSWPTLSDRAKQAFGLAVREKTLAEVWLQTSTLNYCIMRPGGLMSEAATHQAQCYPAEQETHGMINRADVALLILEQLKAPLSNKVYSVIDPTIKLSR